MKIREHDIGEADYEAARAYLDRRALEIDGDVLAVTWKDRVIGSVVAMAVRPKGRRRKT